jgi:antitoxin ParD1/3/4
MPSRTSLNVSLTPQLEKFVQARVESGRYQTASEVVREGLRLLEQQERNREQSFKALKRKLARGAAQAEKGELVDGELYLHDLATRLKRGQRTRKTA